MSDRWPPLEVVALAVLLAVCVVWFVSDGPLVTQWLTTTDRAPLPLPERGEFPPIRVDPEPSVAVILEQGGPLLVVPCVPTLLVILALGTGALSHARRDARRGRRRLAVARRAGIVGLALGLTVSLYGWSQDLLVFEELIIHGNLVSSDLATEPWGARVPVWLGLGTAALAWIGSYLVEGTARLARREPERRWKR